MRVLFVLAGLALALPARADSPEVRADRSLAEASEAVRWENWDKAVAIYERMMAEKLPLPPEFDFDFGLALVRARQDDKAWVALNRYAEKRGRSAPSYERAIAMLVDVGRRREEARLERVQAEERARAEAAAQAEAERARAEQRVKDFKRLGVTLRETLALAEEEQVTAGWMAIGGGAAAALGLLGSVVAYGPAGLLAFSLLPVVLGGGAGVGTGYALGWTDPGTKYRAVSVASAAGVLVALLVGLALGRDGVVPAVLLGLGWVGAAVGATGLTARLLADSRAADTFEQLQRYRKEEQQRLKPAAPPPAPVDPDVPIPLPLSLRVVF
jgi:hypothetical protein